MENIARGQPTKSEEFQETAVNDFVVFTVERERGVQFSSKRGILQGPPETPPIPRNKSGDVTLPARATENNGSVKGRIVRGDVKMVDAP